LTALAWPGIRESQSRGFQAKPGWNTTILVFEGLLSQEPHDDIILDLLFELATWHGFAKLRLHTESTIQALENSTVQLGSMLRCFSSTTCAIFKTCKLSSEEAALALKATSAAEIPETSGMKKGKREWTFNLLTYKIHSLGDYAKAICAFGTTDSYNMQVVSMILYHSCSGI